PGRRRRGTSWSNTRSQRARPARCIGNTDSNMGNGAKPLTFRLVRPLRLPPLPSLPRKGGGYENPRPWREVTLTSSWIYPLPWREGEGGGGRTGKARAWKCRPFPDRWPLRGAGGTYVVQYVWHPRVSRPRLRPEARSRPA